MHYTVMAIVSHFHETDSCIYVYIYIKIHAYMEDIMDYANMNREQYCCDWIHCHIFHTGITRIFLSCTMLPRRRHLRGNTSHLINWYPNRYMYMLDNILCEYKWSMIFTYWNSENPPAWVIPNGMEVGHMWHPPHFGCAFVRSRHYH